MSQRIDDVVNACPHEGCTYVCPECLETALAARDRRIAFLETLFEEIDAINRRHEDAMNAANEYTREIRERVIAALATPPTKDEEGR